MKITVASALLPTVAPFSVEVNLAIYRRQLRHLCRAKKTPEVAESANQNEARNVGIKQISSPILRHIVSVADVCPTSAAAT